jgi:hypothetical protein
MDGMWHIPVIHCPQRGLELPRLTSPRMQRELKLRISIAWRKVMYGVCAARRAMDLSKIVPRAEPRRKKERKKVRKKERKTDHRSV